MLRCRICQEPISHDRIRSFLTISNGVTLPDTCLVHSEEKKDAMLMVYGHKTAGEPIRIASNGLGCKERIRQAFRAYRRAR